MNENPWDAATHSDVLEDGLVDAVRQRATFLHHALGAAGHVEVHGHGYLKAAGRGLSTRLLPTGDATAKLHCDPLRCWRAYYFLRSSCKASYSFAREARLRSRRIEP